MTNKRNLESQINVGIVGATGMVGQRFITLLRSHPFFKISVVASSKRSAGKTYGKLMEERKSWAMDESIPQDVAEMIIADASNVEEVAKQCDFIFCAVSMDKKETLELEERYAKTETPVVSNNSAARLIDDIPMMLPEVNHAHMKIIESQRKRLGTSRGFIAVKPNCSIQSYVPALTPLLELGLEKVMVCTYQAISGAGKTFDSWPEMVDNVIPYIGGEEKKSEIEPMKVWGSIEDGKIVNVATPVISAQCLRVPVSDGHMAALHIKFADDKKKPTIDEIKALWNNVESYPAKLELPSAPKPFITYFEQNDRPQTRIDRNISGGMGVSIGRLREDHVFDYKFVCLSHNTLRGAAGGALLSAELLYKEGYIVSKSDVNKKEKVEA